MELENVYISFFLKLFWLKFKSERVVKNDEKKQICILSWISAHISCFFFGTFVFSDTKMNLGNSDEATSIDNAPSEETTINNEEIYNIESLIDQLIEKIQASADECWRKPAINRKSTMINKLNGLTNLISESNLEDLYDKVLHDIKPKLTGL